MSFVATVAIKIGDVEADHSRAPHAIGATADPPGLRLARRSVGPWGVCFRARPEGQEKEQRQHPTEPGRHLVSRPRSLLPVSLALDARLDLASQRVFCGPQSGSGEPPPDALGKRGSRARPELLEQELIGRGDLRGARTLRRRRPLDEDLVETLLDALIGEQAALGIDRHPLDPRRHRERFRRARGRGPHDVDPDRERSPPPALATAEGAPIVEADPDASDGGGREADKPRIPRLVARPGLARDGSP